MHAFSLIGRSFVASIVLLSGASGGAALAAAGPQRGCGGDADGDGDTDITDLSIVTSDMPCSVGCCGDVDGDGDTDLSDMASVLGSFGCPAGEFCCDEAPVGTMLVRVVPVSSPLTPADPQYKCFYGGTPCGLTPSMTHYTFDLVVDLEDGADWFGADVTATLLATPGVHFFQHPSGAGGGDPPAAGACPPCGSLPFDSYWRSASGVAVTINSVAQADLELSAMWFDTVDSPGGTGLPIARYTIVAPPGVRPMVVPVGSSAAPLLGSISGCTVTWSCVPDCVAVEFDIVNCALVGDLNYDCVVELEDLTRLLGSYGLRCLD